nr:hypothetical protein [uncultured bacterium]
MIFSKKSKCSSTGCEGWDSEAVWKNKDLWNLLPSVVKVNLRNAIRSHLLTL